METGSHIELKILIGIYCYLIKLNMPILQLRWKYMNILLVILTLKIKSFAHILDIVRLWIKCTNTLHRLFYFYYVYSNNCTTVRYKIIQLYNTTRIRLGLFRASSGRERWPKRVGGLL
jgi:hypothetical protein